MGKSALFILSITTLVNFLLGTVILVRGFKERHKILFGFIALGTSVWSLAIAFFYYGQESEGWIRITHLSALFISLAFLYFAAGFTRQKPAKLYLIPLAIFFILSYAILFTNTVVGERTGIEYEIGIGYVYYSLFLAFFFVSGYALLWKQFLSSADDSTKKQLQYVLIGSISSSTLAMFTDLFLPYLGVFQFTWLGPVFTVLLVIFTFLAIYKVHLFNIRVAITELLVFALWLVLLFRTLLAENPRGMLLDGGLLTATILLGIFLIKSVLKEVSQREHIEELAKKLAVANEQLKMLDLQKSEFVSIASHQLRSPLTAIKGYSSMLLEGTFGKVPKKALEAVDKVYQSSQSLVVVIENFLNISRIEQGRMHYDMAPVEMVSLAKQIIDQLSPNAEKKGLSLNFNASGNGNCTVQADAEKIRQCILNLIDNSIKYTPTGSVSVDVKCKEGRVIIEVADTGVGMDEATKLKLFKKFSRAEHADRINAGGAGLGLFLSAEIVKAHSGKIWAESDGINKGSRFFLEIPTA